MIKNDIRYVVKKILIGIGICLGLFYLKSCNVYALENEYYPIMEVQTSNVDSNYTCRDIGTTYNFVFDNTTYEIEYRNNGIFVNNELLSNVNSNLVESQPVNSFLCRGWSVFREQPTGTIIFMLLGNQNHINTAWVDSTTNQPTSIPVRLNRLAYRKNSYVNGDMLLFRSNGVLSYHDLQLSQMTNNCNISSSEGLNCVSYAQVDYYGGTAVSDFLVGFPGNNTTANDYYYTSDFTDNTSVINSINPQPILSDDDSILLGYDFTYSIENFDTDNYKYFYKVGDSPRLQVLQNNFNFSVRTNTTVYFIIEDLEGNLIDSQTFTIFDIGLSYTGQYNITFTYNNLTDSDSTNDSTNVSDLINRVDIDATFFPKSNILKYQYQYVNAGSSLTNNWLLLNNNNSNNVLSYTTHVNGTLYTRILDANDNILYSSTFQVDSIGKLKMYSSSSNRVNSFLSKLTGSINYGGPISSLIVMPINLLNTIISSSSQVCTGYSFGTLLGTEIIFPCVDLEDYTGVVLWRLIDLLMSFGVIMGISRFIKSKYNLLMSLNDDRDVM